jgi:hypothetical protein
MSFKEPASVYLVTNLSLNWAKVVNLKNEC